MNTALFLLTIIYAGIIGYILRINQIRLKRRIEELEKKIK